MQSVLIVFMCVAAAIVYGIVHDQITARVCVEYFTVGHPPVFDTDDPTLLGLGWGVIATWWVGMLLGVPLAAAARAGSRPPQSVRSLLRPVLTLLVVMAVCALVAGIVGYGLGRAGVIVLAQHLTDHLPREKWAAFQADGFAHSASYLVGFLGGCVQIFRVWRSRKPRAGFTTRP